MGKEMTRKSEKERVFPKVVYKHTVWAQDAEVGVGSIY